MSFEEALNSGFNDIKDVFVCVPMKDSLQEAHKRILSAWRQRRRTDGHLILLQGDPRAEYASTPLWKDAGFKNCILPEDIQAHFAEDVVSNKEVFQRVAHACRMAAAARQEGITSGKVAELIEHHMDDPPDNLNQTMIEMLERQKRSRESHPSRR